MSTVNGKLKSTVFAIAMIAAGAASADVQYRIAYTADSNEYVVYMTPDSTPEPDLALSAQVTLKIPHNSVNTDFAVNNINSAVNGLAWHLHSVVKGPAESPEADYLSFGFTQTVSSPPNFGWVAGEEKRIFSFQAAEGCRAGIALLENDDPFNQLPNSTSTNPGNQFTNIGWASANNYTGNYGHSVVCEPVMAEAPPSPRECRKAERKMDKLDWKIKKLQYELAALELQKQRLNAKQERIAQRIDEVLVRQETLAERCPVE